MRWMLGAIFLLAIGIVFQLGLLVYAMYALLGVILLSRFLARHWIESLTATRESSRQIAEIGDRVAVIVDVENSSGLPVPWVTTDRATRRTVFMAGALRRTRHQRIAPFVIIA